VSEAPRHIRRLPLARRLELRDNARASIGQGSITEDIRRAAMDASNAIRRARQDRLDKFAELRAYILDQRGHAS
jgi:hypothetical protein